MHTTYMHVYIFSQYTHFFPYTPTYLHKQHINIKAYTRPTQSMIYVQLLVNRFQKSLLLIVRYKYFQICSKDFILQDLILRTRLCSTNLISQQC